MGPSVRKQSSQGKGDRVVEFALRLNVLSSMTSELCGRVNLVTCAPARDAPNHKLIFYRAEQKLNFTYYLLATVG